MIAKFFKPSGRYFWQNDPPAQRLEIRLEDTTQAHLIRFSDVPPTPATAHLDPRTRFQLEVISALQERAREAYLLVLRAGIGLVQNRPLDEVDVNEAVDMALEVKDREIAELRAAQISQLQMIDRQQAQIEALERVITRRDRTVRYETKPVRRHTADDLR